VFKTKAQHDAEDAAAAKALEEERERNRLKYPPAQDSDDMSINDIMNRYN